MEYKKIKKNNITFHIINTDRFKSINVVLFFTKEANKSDIKYGNLLINNMVYSSKKYNTKNKMAIYGEELFGARVTSSFSITGKCEEFVFSLDFLNPKYTDKKYLDLSLDFLKEIVLNPNVSNNKFKEEYFDILKNDALANTNSIKDNPNTYAALEYAKIMYKGTISACPTIPSEKDLESITSEDLYSFYKTLLDGSYKLDIVCHGEIEDSIVDILYDKFKTIKSNNNKMTFLIKHNYEDKELTKIDNLSYNQSKLYLGYRLINMNYHEMNHVLRLYNTILGTMNDSMLFNIVREANSLCYSIGSYVSKYNPSLNIYAGINKDNYEKSVELIKKCVEDMSEINKVKRLFDSAKKTINTYLNNYYDDVIMQVHNKYASEFEETEDIESLRENINKVTIEEVVSLNKKIRLACIYLLKGDASNG